MLSRRLVRAPLLSRSAARRLPFAVQQRRTFLPESMVGKVDEKYPDSDYPNLTPEEDPNMVRGVASETGSSGGRG